jgi:FdhD protein
MRLTAPVEHDGIPTVAVEEPLGIRVRGEALAVTMRTPGNDEELALGFLHGEGLIDAAGGPYAAGPTPDLAANIVEVDAALRFDPGRRRFYTTSSCGVCGKGALEEVAVHSVPAPPGRRAATLLAPCPERLPARLRATGGLRDGRVRRRRGTAARREGRAPQRLDGSSAARCSTACCHCDLVLCVSGRLSFELVQKAAVAGAPILVGVGAPTSLAVELAADRGLTLCGFARRGRVNVYTGAQRVAR